MLALPWYLPNPLLAPLDVEVLHIERIVFNELAARLDILTH
jgi:hypothetical protein